MLSNEPFADMELFRPCKLVPTQRTAMKRTRKHLRPQRKVVALVVRLDGGGM
jgi:hypothetical protein